MIRRNKFHDYVREKETGQIYTVHSISYGGGEDTYTLQDAEGTSFDIKATDADERFDAVEEIDLSFTLPSIMECAKHNKYLRNTLNAFARRLHPGGYFHPGTYVYFVDQSFESEEERKYHIGREITYMIVDIRQQGGNRIGIDSYPFKVYLTRKGNEKDENGNYPISHTLPLYLDRVVPGDAYTSLKRYDLPY